MRWEERKKRKDTASNVYQRINYQYNKWYKGYRWLSKKKKEHGNVNHTNTFADTKNYKKKQKIDWEKFYSNWQKY